MCGPLSQKDVLVSFTVHNKMTFSSYCVYTYDLCLFSQGTKRSQKKRQIQEWVMEEEKEYIRFHYTNRKFVCLRVNMLVLCFLFHCLFLHFTFFYFFKLNSGNKYIKTLCIISCYIMPQVKKGTKIIPILQCIIRWNILNVKITK